MTYLFSHFQQVQLQHPVAAGTVPLPAPQRQRLAIRRTLLGLLLHASCGNVLLPFC